jgi:hypothetical protein
MKAEYLRIVNDAVDAAVLALGRDATDEEVDEWMVANRPFPPEVNRALAEEELKDAIRERAAKLGVTLTEPVEDEAIKSHVQEAIACYLSQLMKTWTPLDEAIRAVAIETGIAEERLWKMRHSEIQPLFTFADIKIRLGIETSQAEIVRLEAERDAWLDAHPFWRAHMEGKGEKSCKSKN